MRFLNRFGSALDWLLLALGFADPRPFLAGRPLASRPRKAYAVPNGGGPREIARRRRQIERGILKCSPTP